MLKKSMSESVIEFISHVSEMLDPQGTDSPSTCADGDQPETNQCRFDDIGDGGQGDAQGKRETAGGYRSRFRLLQDP